MERPVVADSRGHLDGRTRLLAIRMGSPAPRRGCAVAMLVLTLTACDEPPGLPVEAPAAPEHLAPATEAAAAAVAVPAAGYAIHEWGLVGATLGERLQMAYAGPIPADASGFDGTIRFRAHARGVARKPVIYAHLDPGVDELSFRARVRLPLQARVTEHFPPGVLGEEASALEWPTVVAGRRPCTERTPYPTAASAHCQEAPDGYCEAAELARYETEDGACLVVGDGTYDHLFYRATTRGLLPLHVRLPEGLPGEEADGDEVGEVVVSLLGPDPLPGRIVRVRRAEAFGETLASIHAPPAPGVELRLPAPTTQEAEGGATALRRGLRELGLTGDEADAFMRAWEEDLFGSRGAVETPRTVETPAAELAPRADLLLYWLPAADVGLVSELTFDPPARDVRRAMLVAVDLRRPAYHTVGRSVRLPVVRSGATAEVDGDLALLVVRRHIQRRLSEVLFCYERQLGHQPELEGQLTVDFTIEADGSVSDASLGSSTLDAPGVERCVVSALRRLRFPSAEGRAAVRVRYPFLLTTSD